MAEVRGSIPIEWAGERWSLLPDRAAWWERCRTLIVADVHLGKAAAFRSAGIPVPEVVHAELDRIDLLLDQTRAEQLLVVGDLIHAAAGRSATVLKAVAQWRSRRSTLAVTLVRGNHDRQAGDPPSDWHIAVHDAPFIPFEDASVAFVHDPETESCPDRRCIGGHLHPAITLDDGLTGLKARCFWMRDQSLVMPAFGRFTGSSPIRPCRGERVFAMGDGEIVEVRAATRANRAAATQT